MYRSAEAAQRPPSDRPPSDRPPSDRPPSDRRPPGRRRAGRLRELIVAGLVDSFGLALGWTLFNLLAVAKGGLATAALFNAAMLVGVVLSAPVTAWLAHRLHGRALLAGAPDLAVAAGVIVMHLAAFSGFAAMRAEVAAVDSRATAMTRYALCIAAVEAGGAGLAALLPLGPGGGISGGLLTAVSVLYVASLLPTLVTARRARVTSARESPATETTARPGRVRLPVPVLAGGALVMLFASGPTLLSVALASELYGHTSVAGAAIAFSAGCLLSALAVRLIGRLRLPRGLLWPLWGVGMLAGWIIAPWHLAGLLLAQLLSGLSLTAFEGGMDARVARNAAPGTVTTVLAWSAATRAMGGAVAVRLLPMLIAAPAIGLASGLSAAALSCGALVTWLVVNALSRAATSARHRAEPPRPARIPPARRPTPQDLARAA